MSTSFADRCREHMVDAGSGTLASIDGAQHLVMLGDTRVWRFPRHRRDCARIHEMAERIEAAERRGLGAPRVIAVVPGPPGHCHLVLSRVPGTSLLRAREGGQPIVHAIGTALSRLRATTDQDWHFPQVAWETMWSNFADTAGARRDLLPPEQVQALLVTAQIAAEVAAQAPIRIVHGDLASDNIMVGDDGSLSGILDWDGAVLGDPAIDTAASLHVLDRPERDALLSAHPPLAEDLVRWEAYRDTWTLQNLLWKQGLTPPLWGGTAR